MPLEPIIIDVKNVTPGPALLLGQELPLVLKPAGVAGALLLAGYQSPHMVAEAKTKAEHLRQERQRLMQEAAEVIPAFGWAGQERLFPGILSAAQLLEVTLAAPVLDSGGVDPARPDEIANMIGTLLFHGVRMDSPFGPQFFESVADARAFGEDPTCALQATEAIFALDAINKVIPKRTPAPEQTEDEASAEDPR